MRNQTYRMTARRMRAPGFRKYRNRRTRGRRNYVQKAVNGETIMTYDIPLPSITKAGGAFAIGPDQKAYAKLKYGVDALSWNNYHVKAVSAYWVTAMNETNAVGQIAVYLSMDAQTKVPSTDEEVLAQVSAADKLGDVFFSSDKKYSQARRLNLKTPPGNQVNYQTGQGDGGSGAAYQEQGRLVVAVLNGAAEAATKYGTMFMRVTVGWSSPGAPNPPATRTITKPSVNSVDEWVTTETSVDVDTVEILWTHDYASTRKFMIISRNSTEFYKYPIATSLTEAKKKPTWASITPKPTSTTNIWWQDKKAPEKGPNNEKITITERAWNDTDQKWEDKTVNGIPVYLTSKVVLDQSVVYQLAGMVHRLEQERAVKIAQASAETGEIIEPMQVEIVKQPVEVSITGQPIAVEVKNEVKTNITSPVSEVGGQQCVNTTQPKSTEEKFGDFLKTVAKVAAVVARNKPDHKTIIEEMERKVEEKKAQFENMKRQWSMEESFENMMLETGEEPSVEALWEHHQLMRMNREQILNQPEPMDEEERRQRSIAEIFRNPQVAVRREERYNGPSTSVGEGLKKERETSDYSDDYTSDEDDGEVFNRIE